MEAETPKRKGDMSINKYGIRTSQPEYQGGRIYPPNPEAHAKLRAFWLDQPRATRVERARHAGQAAAGRRIQLTQEQIADVLQRLKDNESLTTIAADFGMSAMTLSLRVREAGYTTKRQGGRRLAAAKGK